MKLIRVVPAVAAVAMLAACSPMPGVALVAGDTTYSESQVDDIMTGCAEALEVDVNQLDRRGVVQNLLLGSVFDTVASQGETGQAPSDAEIDELVPQATSGGDKMLANSDCAPLARAVTKFTLLQQVSDEQLLRDGLVDTHVQLNPIYGTWVPEDPNVLFNTSGSLSILASNAQ